LAAFQATAEQVMMKSKQDTLLKLIVKANDIPDDARDSSGRRTSYALLHEIKDIWSQVNNGEQCLSSIEIKQMAIEAVDKIMLRHTLTEQEKENFWEIFNYTYVHSNNLAKAPNLDAGIRAWLQDSDGVWNQVKNKGALGTRVEKIRRESGTD